MKSLQKLFFPMTEAGDTPEDLLTALFDSQGAKQMPNIWNLVQETERLTGDGISVELYRRLFDPLSMLYAHAGPLSLGRHVRPNGTVRRVRPMRAWSSVAAKRSADACLGFLAERLARHLGHSAVIISAYASEKWTRTPIPLLFIIGSTLPTSISWNAVPRAVRALRSLSIYYRSGDAYRDGTEVRAERTSRGMIDFFGVFGDVVDQGTVERMSGVLVELLSDATRVRPMRGRGARP